MSRVFRGSMVPSSHTLADEFIALSSSSTPVRRHVLVGHRKIKFGLYWVGQRSDNLDGPAQQIETLGVFETETAAANCARDRRVSDDASIFARLFSNKSKSSWNNEF